MINHDTPQQNHLLGALPADQYECLFSNLERVPMPLGEVLYESGEELRYVYFPTTCIVSKFYVIENGASTEIAVVGNEGIIGISLFMGGGTMPNRAIVRNEGYAYRLRRHLFIQAFDRHHGRRHDGALHHLLLRYTQALITQMAQSAVCNRHHSVYQQLCRSLLQSLDRLASNELTITQELIANMLGVRREGVTEAAGRLQKAGLIDYHRGHITVLDRQGLETQVCECYQVVKTEFDRLIPAQRNDSLTPAVRTVHTHESLKANVVHLPLKRAGRRKPVMAPSSIRS
ncbi:MAG: Crp/Fnr family transcriptional regulator [Methylococcaceae bacterium]